MSEDNRVFSQVYNRGFNARRAAERAGVDVALVEKCKGGFRFPVATKEEVERRTDGDLDVALGCEADEGVDGRDKPGHDDAGKPHFIAATMEMAAKPQPIAGALARLAGEDAAMKDATAAAATRDVPTPRNVGSFQFHPIANAFPLIEGEEFEELIADVKAKGVRLPIILFENKILDGRNRWRAAMAAGASCRFAEYVGADPIDFVVSLNLHRRHLSESQRAYAMAELEKLRPGIRKGEGGELARADLARRGHVSERSIASAAVVRDRGSDALKDAVRHDRVSVSTASAIAGLPPAEQDQIVARGEKEIIAKAKELQGQKRKAKREARMAVVAGRVAIDCPWPDQRFAILYADPPWRYENPPMGKTDKSIENHYPTMPLADICALPVHEHVTDAAVLFLWVTPPQAFCRTPEGLTVVDQVCRAWGDRLWNDPKRCRPEAWFTPKAQIVWDKVKMSKGYYVREQHELLIIATRGKMPVPDEKARPRSVQRIPRGRHSEKPDFYHLIERMYPGLDRLELFARGAPVDARSGKPRKGWHVWGNEAKPAAVEHKAAA